LDLKRPAVAHHLPVRGIGRHACGRSYMHAYRCTLAVYR
jgi:hypothetical protein